MKTIPRADLKISQTYFYSSVPLKFNKETLVRSGSMLVDSVMHIIDQPEGADYVEIVCRYNWAIAQGSLRLSPTRQLISTWHRSNQTGDYVGILEVVPGLRQTFTPLHFHHSLMPPHFYAPNTRTENFASKTIGIVEYRDLQIDFNIASQRIVRIKSY